MIDYVGVKHRLNILAVQVLQTVLRVEFPGWDCGWMHMHLR